MRRRGPTVEVVLLGFGTGMMLAAAFWSLLAPAIAQLRDAVGSGAAGLHAIAAFLLCAGAVAALDALTPHAHPSKGREGVDLFAIRRTWLFVTAITLHNIPEGLAVGVGLGSGVPAISVPVVLGIALQNLPEGLVVAMSLLRIGWPRGRAMLVGIASGAIEPLATAIGFAAVAVTSGLLPYALAAAAGAMIYVVSGEVIPESELPRRRAAIRRRS